MATVHHPSREAPQERSRAAAGTMVAAVQGVIYMATGVWPLVHIESFLAVTGQKTDLWLVYTVGVLITVVGAVLLLAARSGRTTPEVVLLAVASALSLAAIDTIFVTRGVIPPVYLADAAVEVLLVVWWGAVVSRHPPGSHDR